MRLSTSRTGRNGLLVKKFVVTLTLTAAATMGTAVITAAPAQALPSSCTKLVKTTTNAVVCKTGTGYYRAYALCTNTSSKNQTYRYGFWRQVGSIASNASCFNGETIVSPSKDAGWQRTSTSPPP